MFPRSPSFLALALFGGMLLSQHADAGIVLSGTRLVFDGTKREASTNARNTSDVPYVVQAWVEAQDGSTDTPFFVTPALSRIDGEREGLLRVLRVNDTLPEDRESMYWLNVKEIPKIDKRDNVLQIAVRTRIKIFYRPAGLKNAPRGAAMLDWKIVRNAKIGKCALAVKNNSAYYVTLSDIAVGYGSNAPEKLKISAIAPLSGQDWSLPSCAQSIQLSYSVVNDFGATEEIPPIQVNLTSNEQSESSASH
ncbi:molecular chaperone [Burkholderia pyrrocinia]|uniref:fimbrial biogenesis chaperone n=1 Tax=Burkholderia TaxID=32008 RepID=UPI00158EA1CB|nr:molecular chaperone [Burkholderia cenocepacia]EKS9886947.1 molecular chaperone [Burkholderia pyrrocinia]EKS9895902.1 molecular chaperone [Burkholderia pyrrocinia]EKS9908575.1 molecular chaperone [Burkholderia pyrrocinia]